MKKNLAKTAAACGLCLTLLAGATLANAAYGGAMNQPDARTAFSQMNQMNTTPFGGQTRYVSAAGTIVSGTTTNSAASLTADEANATTITMSDENNTVKLKEAGTYIVTGTCADGSITVTKGTTGVVLILRDLNLTSTTGATLSINKGAEGKVIVSGSVTLTDAENPDDENSADADVADAFDGAALKVKAGASAYLTGTGTLTLNGSAKNGVKVSANEDDGNGSLVIDGATVNITAANDGVNAEYDLAILSGSVTVSAGDDGIHADRVLTIGAEGKSPSVTVSKSTEGIEATVVNLAGGTVKVTASEDGVNAANSVGTYAALGYSVNVTGADVTIGSRADGIDSNGNINLVSGSATISSANNGGDAGLDCDGQLYVSDSFKLNNQSGVASMGGGMGGDMRRNGQQQNSQTTQPTQEQTPAQNPQTGGMPMQGMNRNRQTGGMMGGMMNGMMGGMMNGMMGGMMNGRMGR